MQFDLLQRMKYVLTWAAIISVTSATTRSRTPLFDQSVPTVEQYTDTWVVQLLLPQSQLTLEAHTLATRHGLINQGQVQYIYLLSECAFFVTICMKLEFPPIARFFQSMHGGVQLTIIF